MLQWLPRSIAKCDHIITISENSKREIIEEFNVPEEKITIAQPAVDHGRFKPANEEELAQVRKKYELPEQYLLYVGTIEPRKNLLGLLEAYEKLPAKLRGEYPLVMTGGRGWLEGEIVDRISRLKGRGEALTTGYVYDEDLPAIYSGARLFVFPSFYEGWGMPPLEAMACGTPVITSNTSSLPEVVGDTALMIDPNRPEELTNAMKQVLSDEELRQEMIRQGFKQAKRFSWEKSARKLLTVIRSFED